MTTKEIRRRLEANKINKSTKVYKLIINLCDEFDEGNRMPVISPVQPTHSGKIYSYIDKRNELERVLRLCGIPFESNNIAPKGGLWGCQYTIIGLRRSPIKKAKERPISEIAREISSDWKKVYFGAYPYLDAMFSLNTINDNYGFDTGKEIVLRFLSNASTWKGEVAKRIKAELKGMTKNK